MDSAFPIPVPLNLDVVDYVQLTTGAYAHLGYPPYRWAENPEPVRLAPLDKPLSGCRLTLIASGGIYQAGQVAFNHRDDTSHRRIPTDVDVDRLRVSHFAYDVSDARRDPNVVFPIVALRKLVADGVLGGLSRFALTFMGGISSQRRVRDELTPRLLGELRDMRTDIALLVPV